MRAAPARSAPYEEEWAKVQLAREGGEPIPVGGPVLVSDMSLERLLVVADALAKSVVLAHDEKEVANVFDTIEPFARELATSGQTSKSRTDLLKLLGNSLLVQHHVAGRVAVDEKPDVLWDRPDLERLYARLEDEYELSERVETSQPQARSDLGHRDHARRHPRGETLAAAGADRHIPDRVRDYRDSL